MSQSNIEILRNGYEAATRGELEQALAFLEPEFEFHAAGILPDVDSVYTSRDRFREFVETFTEPWEQLSVLPERYIELDNGVLVLGRFRAKGRAGIEVDLPFFQRWTMKDGRATRLQGYADEADALAGCGLPASALQ